MFKHIIQHSFSPSEWRQAQSDTVMGNTFKQIYKDNGYANQYRTFSLKKRNRVNL